MRRSVLTGRRLLLPLLVGCTPSPQGRPGPEPQVAERPTAPVVVASIPSAPAAVPDAGAVNVEASIEALARPYARSEPRVLYTWTTPEQLAELKGGTAVLSRDSSKVQGHANVDHYLSLHAHRKTRAKTPLGWTASVLFQKAFARKRFAWITALGTVRGLGGAPYGSVLMRITLRPEAIHVNVRGTTFSADGKDLPMSDLARYAPRIGAAFFDTREYQEYFVPNESMIAEIAVGTPDIEKELADERHLLAEVRRELVASGRLHPAAHVLFAGKVPATVAELVAYEDALEKVAASFPREPFVRRLESAPSSLGEARASGASSELRPPLALLCRESGRQALPSDSSFPQPMFRLTCTPGDVCIQSGSSRDPFCEPSPSPFE
ncbi:MAG: hypothetical protein HOO96_06115 [Polyangiaceae bacterium]|nr:hypothetical protein [Polyangiaceae bacterium]